MLSQQAFNAFLKTLEEPPAHAIFILATTEKHKILPTILSRCQTYDFNRIGIRDMMANLRGIAQKEGITIDDKALHVIAVKADGAMRDALTIFDQTVAFCGTDVKYEDVIRNLNVLDSEYSFKMVNAFLAGDYATALRTFDEVLAKGFNALHFVAALSSHFRDLAVAATAGLDAQLELPDSLKEQYKEQASRCGMGFIYEALNITTACEAGYKAAVNPRLHIEFALMKLSFITAGAPKVAANSPSATNTGGPLPFTQPRAATPAGSSDSPADSSAAPARRRTPKTGSALSMNAIMEEKEEEAKPAEVIKDIPLPGDDAVKAKWKELAAMYSDRPRLANTLGGANLDISEEGGTKVVRFYVINQSQKSWIEEKLLRDLEKKYRDLLSCPRVNILVEVTPDTEVKEKAPYMPEEKAKDLIEKNPNVRDFVSALSLDTK